MSEGKAAALRARKGGHLVGTTGGQKWGIRTPVFCLETVSVNQLRARPELQSGNGVTE